MNLESAKPAVDQPVAKVDVRRVRQIDVVTLTLWLGPQLPRWSLLLYPNRKIWIYKIKRTKRVSYSLYIQKRELSSHEWELSPEIQYIQIDTKYTKRGSLA